MEKTSHQCQFPIALVQRLVRALTPQDSVVFDPYLGVGSAVCAAILEGRRGWGAEIDPGYAEIARDRAREALEGNLRFRPIEKPIHEPTAGSTLLRRDDIESVRGADAE